MRKTNLLIVSLIAVWTFCFTSCEKSSGDVLQGTWKNNSSYAPNVNMDYIDMTYVFDGDGNYTFTITEPKYGTRKSKGTYKHEAESKLVRLHEVYTNAEGITKEYDNDIWLDISVKPATLTCTRLFDEEIAAIVYVKQ